MAVLRHFNRAWSQRVGVLEESFLGSGRPLGPSRMLFEIGPDGIGVRQLRERLGLDAGYVSRLLRNLEREGLVTTSPDGEDARRRSATLTAAGREAWSDLEQRSDDVARRIVEPLPPSQRVRLAEALRTADALMRAATAELVEVELSSPPARAALSAYFAELDLRFPGGFDPGAQDPDAYRPPRGRFIVALSDGGVVACGAVQQLSAGIAEIKRMWVDPEWRGRGLAGRMLRKLESLAAADGNTVVRLDTNPTLTDAIAMYRRAGYAEIPRYNDNPYAGHWFEKVL
ncbi:MAG: Transcriptional regulatory protein MarR [Rhodoglobus sp.]|nr:Transcriptional regulatory protein MarR [Rhodoglobus sp.]